MRLPGRYYSPLLNLSVIPGLKHMQSVESVQKPSELLQPLLIRPAALTNELVAGGADIEATRAALTESADSSAGDVRRAGGWYA